MRTDPTYYIAPSAISITPNANESPRDLAVYIARGTKIKVYEPKINDLGTVDAAYQEWTLTGRNRRLADTTGTVPYTIYARLKKVTDWSDEANVAAAHADAYLVFAPMTLNEDTDEYEDPYVLSPNTSRYGGTGGTGADGKTYTWQPIPARQAEDGRSGYWWVKVGEVSTVDAVTGLRTVELDTGILGTDQFNTEWDMRPDALPLRVELTCTVNDEDVGQTPYVKWGKRLTIQASLVEGWEADANEKVKYWTIERNTGSAEADETWNHPAAIDEETGEEMEGETTDRRMTDGRCVLSHIIGGTDDFNAAVAANFTITAWGESKEEEESSEQTEETEPEPVMVPLATTVITVFAETVATYELELSDAAVTYNPAAQTYSPAAGVTVRIRAKAHDGSVSYPNAAHITAAQLKVFYLPVGEEEGENAPPELTLTNGIGTLATSLFQTGKSLNLWLENGAQVVLARTTVAYIRYGEKGDTPISIYRWYKDGLTPRVPTATDSDEPAPASGDATGAANVYLTGKWSKTVPDRPETGDWVLWKCYSIKHGVGTIDAWQGPVQESGINGSPGEDGSDREYIYIRLSVYPFSGTLPANIATGTVPDTNPDSPTYGKRISSSDTTKDDWVPSGWSDTALPAADSEKYVYVAMRDKPAGHNEAWGPFSSPVLWANWGVQGTDGDGVQYVYKLFPTELTPAQRASSDYIPDVPLKADGSINFNGNGEIIPTGSGKNADWSDDPLSPTSSLPYCYCSVIKHINGAWGQFGELGLWSTYSESITITSQEIAYATTDNYTNPASLAASAWSTTYPSAAALTEGKWLHVRTTVNYSDENSTVSYSSSRTGIDGNGIDSTVVKYASTTANLTMPADDAQVTWYDNYTQLGTLAQGTWLWVKTTITYSKLQTPVVSYSVSRISSDGTAYLNTEEFYAVSASNTTAPTGCPNTNQDGSPQSFTALQWAAATIGSNWSENRPTSATNSSTPYLWNFEVSVFSDGHVVCTTPICVGNFARGIRAVIELYGISANGNKTAAGLPAETVYQANGTTQGWTDELNSISPTDALPYLWNKTITVYNDSVADSSADGWDDITCDVTYHVCAVKGENGPGQPDYIQTQEAWSNVESVANITTEPVPNGGWSDTTPANPNNYAYLWRRSRKMVLQSDGTYAAASGTDGQWKYTRLSGTNGTSIKTKGSLAYAIVANGTLPTSGFSSGDLAIKQGDATLWQYNGSSWAHNSTTASDGDSYTVTRDCTIDLDGDGTGENIKGHLVMWSAEASKWIGLGQFKGDSGTTYYTHIAWASSVTTGTFTGTLPAGQISTPNVASLADVTEGSVSPGNGKYWMGVLINTDSGADTTNWHYYTWQYTRGPQGVAATVYNLMPTVDSVNFSRDSNNSLTPSSITVGCGLEKKVGNERTYYEAGQALPTTEKLNMMYRLVKTDGTHVYINGSTVSADGSDNALDWAWMSSQSDNAHQEDGVWTSDFTVTIQASGGYVALEFAIISANPYHDRLNVTEDLILVKKRIPILYGGTNGNNGVSPVVYTLQCTPDAVNFRSDAVGNFLGSYTVSCKVMKTIGDVTSEVTASDGTYDGMYLKHHELGTSGSYNSWTQASSISLNPGDAIESLFVATEFALATDSSMTHIKVRAGVPITLDGRIGATGAAGRMFRPRGTYNDSATYVRNSEFVDLVFFDDGSTNNVNSARGHYYYVSEGKTSNVSGSTHYAPASTDGDGNSYSYQSGFWTLADDFAVVITQAVFAEYAKMGSAIMSGDYMFSMNGRIGSTNYDAGQTYTAGGVTLPAYTWFKGDPSQQTGTFFNPNWWVDLRTGKMSAARGNFITDGDKIYAINGDFSGTVRANNLFRNIAVCSGSDAMISADEYGRMMGQNNKIANFESVESTYIINDETTKTWVYFGSNVTLNGFTFMAKTYYTLQEVESHCTEYIWVDCFMRQDNEGNTINCCVCTGPADEVILTDESASIPFNNYVVLPRCQDYVGKTITIRHTYSDGTNSAKICQVDYASVFTNRCYISMVSPSGGPQHLSITHPSGSAFFNLSIGSTAVLYSVGNYWMVLSVG